MAITPAFKPILDPQRLKIVYKLRKNVILKIRVGFKTDGERTVRGQRRGLGQIWIWGLELRRETGVGSGGCVSNGHRRPLAAIFRSTAFLTDIEDPK